MSRSLKKFAVQIADDQISENLAQLQNNESIGSFNVKVDKRSGVVRYSANYVDGRTVTKTVLSPGLEEITRYNPNGCSTNDRNTAILTLLDKGLSQAEVGSKLGVSQSLVSKVKNSKLTF